MIGATTVGLLRIVRFWISPVSSCISTIHTPFLVDE